MNKQQQIKHLKSKLNRLDNFKLNLQNLIRVITDEIICTNDELACLQAGKPIVKHQKKQPDISKYIADFWAKDEIYRQNSKV